MDYMITSYTSPKGNHITVRRPILSLEQKERRMAAIKQACIELVIATERVKQERIKRNG